MQKSFLFLILLFPFTFSDNLHYYQDENNEQIITSIELQTVPCEIHTDCSECLSSSCLWCDSMKPQCFNPRKPFYCPKDYSSASIGLISDLFLCKALSTPFSCSSATDCTACLQAGCKWCDGDGSTMYPPICVGLSDPIDCTIGALHFPGESCDCQGVSPCANCVATYGCAWCDGDGSTMYPGMCVNPHMPFGCAISAFHPYGSSC